jgi:hypothetical protein
MMRMRTPRALPIAVGVVVVIAGFLQFTAWKARHLACCWDAPGRACRLPADADTADASASTAAAAAPISWRSLGLRVRDKQRTSALIGVATGMPVGLVRSTVMSRDYRSPVPD